VEFVKFINSATATLADMHKMYISVALQAFVGPWPLFQFLDLLHGL
jgi:hypothetical protein